MADERFNLPPNEDMPEGQGENTPAPEAFEEFLAEQAGDVPADAIPDPVEPVGDDAHIATPQEASEPVGDDAHIATPQDTPAAPTPPPAWGDAGYARINMQVKKKKKHRWIPVVVICVVVFYVLLTAAVVGGVIRIAKDLDIGYNPATGRFEVHSDHSGGILFGDREEPAVQEHLEIMPTPDASEEVVPSGGKLTVKQVAKKVRASVVGVVAEGSMNFSSSSVGSGIIMSADGYIITNNHVIENAAKITVVTDDGTNYPANVIGTDSRTDLAVLKVDATGLPAAEFGDSDKLEQGDPAIAIGNPAGIQLQNTVTSGVISAINRNIVVEDEEMTLLQTDASINPGNSGGPLVNEYGQVIGINTVKIGISYYEGLGFAIPINTAKPIIDELISRGYITGRPSIGISGATLTERDAAFYGLKAGMYVEFVHPYSDAFRKGLQAGDVIVAMNGTSLTSTEEIKKIRDDYKAGDTVTLTIYRQGREFTISVVLMDEAELNKMGQPTNGRS